MAVWIVIIALALLLQMTIFGFSDMLGIRPDLVLITVMYAAFYRGAARGGAVGFLGGMAEDIASGGILGINGFIKLSAGFLLGLLRRRFDYGNRFFQSAAVLVVSAAAQFCFFLISGLCGREMDFNYLGGVILYSGLINAVIAPFAFWALKGVAKYDRSKPD